MSATKKRKQFFPVSSVEELSKLNTSRLIPLAPSEGEEPLRVLVMTEVEHRNMLALVEAVKKWKTCQDDKEERACCGYENISKKRDEKLYQAITRMV